MQRKPFSTYPVTAVAVGTFAAIFVINPDLPDLFQICWWWEWNLLAAPLILLIPGIVRRSWWRLIAGPLLAVLLMIFFTALVSFFLTLNGRDALPRAVLQTPYVHCCVPWYDDLALGWQARSLLVFTAFWLPIDYLLLSLGPGRLRIGLRGLWAMVLSYPVLLVLYPLSWTAKLSGTFQRPLASYGEELFSLLALGLVFAAKPSALFIIHHRLGSPRGRSGVDTPDDK